MARRKKKKYCLDVFCDGSLDGFRVGTVDDVHLFALHEIVEGGDGSDALSLHQFGSIGGCITNHLARQGTKSNTKANKIREWLGF